MKHSPRTQGWNGRNPGGTCSDLKIAASADGDDPYTGYCGAGGELRAAWAILKPATVSAASTVTASNPV
jgi:hypothetical protein